MRSARDQMLADQLVSMGFVASEVMDEALKQWEKLVQSSAEAVPLVPFLIQKKIVAPDQMDIVLNALKQFLLKIDNLSPSGNTKKVVKGLTETTYNDDNTGSPPPIPKLGTNTFKPPEDDFSFQPAVLQSSPSDILPKPASAPTSPPSSFLDLSIDSGKSSTKRFGKEGLFEKKSKEVSSSIIPSKTEDKPIKMPSWMNERAAKEEEAMRGHTMDIMLPSPQKSQEVPLDILPPPTEKSLNLGNSSSFSESNFERGPDTKAIDILQSVPPGGAIPPTDEELFVDSPPPPVIQKIAMIPTGKEEGILSAEKLAGTTIAGYKLEKMLGKGAMGVIYLAENIGLKRKVAVKILSPQMTANPKKVKQFFREGRAAAKIEHPNVVQVYQVGEERGIYYLVMEYVDGANLKQVLKQKHLLEVDQAFSYFLQTCEGLQCAHAAGIIHRDIKPENIMLKTETNTAKIADFGIAKQQDEEDSSFTVNESGHLVGTPAYMSPEQIDCQKVDLRSDIYSMGVMFYYLLLGREPHIGETPVKTLLKHLSEPLTFPENHGIPPSLVNMIKKMMAKRQEERYRTISDVIQDLNDYKKGKEIKKEVDSKPLAIVFQQEVKEIKRMNPFAKARWV
ncbi:MAG: serine/threonine-protein kinase, partial [Planctomycetota bacterium]